jgi:hypothetical protein
MRLHDPSAGLNSKRDITNETLHRTLNPAKTTMSKESQKLE